MSILYGTSMARPRRVAPQTHIVLVDTNILFDEDKTNPVNPDFNSFWMTAAALIPLELRIPEVVFGELHFQQATSALKLSGGIRDSFAKLAGITQAPYVPRLEDTKIKGQVKKKIEHWLRSLGGSIAPTPLATVDWASLVESAVWRVPPFSFDPKNKDNEKGFRDALILETVAAATATATSTETVIFLSNDALLREATERRLKAQKNFLAFESIPDFESYIQLTQQQLTDKFVKEIQAHARAKFFSPNDESALYAREKLSTRIRADYQDLLTTPPKYEAGTMGLLGSALSQQSKKVAERWWISSTRFDQLTGDREFHWISEIIVAQLYDYTPNALAASVLPQLAGAGQIRLVKFDVKWRANVKADGRFHDITVSSIEHTQSLIEEPTAEKLARWQLSNTQQVQ